MVSTSLDELDFQGGRLASGCQHEFTTETRRTRRWHGEKRWWGGIPRFQVEKTTSPPPCHLRVLRVSVANPQARKLNELNLISDVIPIGADRARVLLHRPSGTPPPGAGPAPHRAP